MIQKLISENEPYQRLNDLVEMIGETFRRPKDMEKARWWSLGEITQLFLVSSVKPFSVTGSVFL